MDFISCKDIPLWAQILVANQPATADMEAPCAADEEEPEAETIAA